jgi:hypothetical protein
MGFSAALVLVVLVVLAIRADVAAPHASAWLIVLDVATGMAFVVAAALAPGSHAERGLMAAVGLAWLTASFLPAARSVHQAVLVVALIAFPAGRVRGSSRWLVVGLAVPVAIGLLPQIAVAALFAVVALLVLIGGRGIPPPSTRRSQLSLWRPRSGPRGWSPVGGRTSSIRPWRWWVMSWCS